MCMMAPLPAWYCEVFIQIIDICRTKLRVVKQPLMAQKQSASLLRWAKCRTPQKAQHLGPGMACQDCSAQRTNVVCRDITYYCSWLKILPVENYAVMIPCSSSDDIKSCASISPHQLEATMCMDAAKAIIA